MKYWTFVTLSLALATSARPTSLDRRFSAKQNGEAAITLNFLFGNLDEDSTCTDHTLACVNGEFAQCVNGKFVLQPCAAGLICAALPLVNAKGTTVACTTVGDRDARIAATGADKVLPTLPDPPAASGTAPPASTDVAPPASTVGVPPPSSTDALPPPPPPPSTTDALPPAPPPPSTTDALPPPPPPTTTTDVALPASTSAAAGDNAAGGGAATGEDAQTSLTLLRSVIATGFANDGQDTPTAGQVASLTSTNNFINFCATVPQLKITNGLQIPEGSCNPTPMGVIPSTGNMPSSKFVFPKNFGTVPANTNFTIQMAIQNLETGNFVNAAQNYFSAPQTVNAQGNIIGHSHVVIDPLPALDSVAPTDPLNDFVFFKGLNEQAVGGVLSVEVPGGLPAGFYRLASINSAANHQPALVAIAQHGSLDDMIYFTAA